MSVAGNPEPGGRLATPIAAGSGAGPTFVHAPGPGSARPDYGVVGRVAGELYPPYGEPGHRDAALVAERRGVR